MGLGDIVYQPGISFRNAEAGHPATKVRRIPWFQAPHVYAEGPLTRRSKLSRWTGGSLNRYRAVWNRQAKANNVQKLGAYFAPVPTIDELGLGQVPTAGNNESSTSRSPFGFLENILTDISEAGKIGLERIIAEEKRRTEEAQTQFKFLTEPMQEFGSTVQQNWPLILLGGAAIGVGVIMFSRGR